MDGIYRLTTIVFDDISTILWIDVWNFNRYYNMKTQWLQFQTISLSTSDYTEIFSALNVILLFK